MGKAKSKNEAALTNPSLQTPPASAARPTHVRYAVMAFLCVLSFLTYFDRVCITRAQNDVQRDLHISDRQMGWVLGAFWLAYGLFEIPSGWVGDRFGARKGLSRIVLAWSLFTALSGCATGFVSLVACRFLFGVGEAGAYPNMARIQSAWLPIKSRARAGGLLWLAARWGAAFSPILFGLFLRASNSPAFRDALARLPVIGGLSTVPAWRMAFLFSGILGVVWVLLFWPWFRDDPSEKRSTNAAELAQIRAGRPSGATGGGHAVPSGVWGALFTSPTLWGMALLYLCGSFGYSFFVSWMPKYFDKVLKVPFEKSEWMSAAPQFCAGIACLAGGWMSDWLVRRTGRKRFGRAIFPVVGCLLAAAAMYGIRFVHTPQQAVVLMCVAAAAYDFGQGANWATIVDVGGLYAGTAAGFINMIGNMGNFLQPVLGEIIFRRLGWNALFFTYAATYLAAGAMWVMIDPNRRFHDRVGEAEGTRDKGNHAIRV